MSETELDPRPAVAEAYLRANGVEGITIKGAGEDWFVSIGFGEHERFVTAYSAKNPATPTDPMYLAEQALAALIRNERPRKPAPVVLTTEATLAAPVLSDPPPTEDAMAQPININVAPVFNIGGSHSESGATQSEAKTSPVNVDADGRDEYGNRPEDVYEAEVPQHPESEQAGEAAETVADIVSLGDDAPAAEDTGGAQDGEPSGGGALQPYDGQDGPGDGEREYAFDADYEEAGEELGAELLDDDAFALGELPAPAPEDFAPEEIAATPEPEQARFYGLDDLDRIRSLRIGDVATEALRLTTMIEQAVSETEGEFAAIQAYVVSHLDKHTGAFTPQDDASRATYGRFLELSSARNKTTLIDARRKEATAFLLDAEREAVLGFDVKAAFA